MAKARADAQELIYGIQKTNLEYILHDLEREVLSPMTIRSSIEEAVGREDFAAVLTLCNELELEVHSPQTHLFHPSHLPSFSALS